MLARQDQHQLVLPKSLAAQVADVRAFDKNAHIATAFAQSGHHAFGHLLFEVEAHLRDLLGISRQQGWQKLVECSGVGTQANVARHALLQIADFVAELRHRLHQGQAMPNKHPSCRGQGQPPGVAFKQGAAQRLFEFTQAPARRGHRQMHLACGLRQAATLRTRQSQANRDQVKANQVRQVHASFQAAGKGRAVL